MLKRVLAILLIPCTLAAQSSALGHSHASPTEPAHDHRPHFHVHSHSHHEGHEHPHSHPHDHEECAYPEKSPADHDHDEDAVFFDIDTVLSERCVLSDAEESSSPMWTVALSLWGVNLSDNLRSSHPFWPHPPPLDEAALPLYLQFLAILL